MPFRFLDHAADVRVECRGETFSDLLESAARALYAVAFKSTQTRVETQHVIDLHAESLEEMLVHWLQELIFLMEVKYFAGTVFTFDQEDAGVVRATVLGYVYRPEERETEIKAATYHRLDVHRDNNEFVAEVIIDL